MVPHGGVFVLPIPNAATNMPMYVVALAAGTLVTTAALFVLKRPLVEKMVKIEAIAQATN
jgi:PTS system fructose-specific IIC component